MFFPACVGFLWALRFPHIVRRHADRLIVDSKLPVGVKGCLFLYVSPERQD